MTKDNWKVSSWKGLLQLEFGPSEIFKSLSSFLLTYPHMTYFDQIRVLYYSYLPLIFFEYWGLNSGPHACSGTLPLESLCQPPVRFFKCTQVALSNREFGGLISEA
jgi:hypothetical protein